MRTEPVGRAGTRRSTRARRRAPGRHSEGRLETPPRRNAGLAGLAIVPERAILAALDAVLDLTQRTLDAALPEPRNGHDPDELLASHLHQLADQMREAILAYHELFVADE